MYGFDAGISRQALSQAQKSLINIQIKKNVGKGKKIMELIKQLETTEKKLKTAGYNPFSWGHMGIVYRKGKEMVLVKLNCEVWKVNI